MFNLRTFFYAVYLLFTLSSPLLMSIWTCILKNIYFKKSQIIVAYGVVALRSPQVTRSTKTSYSLATMMAERQNPKRRHRNNSLLHRFRLQVGSIEKSDTINRLISVLRSRLAIYIEQQNSDFTR